MSTVGGFLKGMQLDHDCKLVINLDEEVKLIWVRVFEHLPCFDKCLYSRDRIDDGRPGKYYFYWYSVILYLGDSVDNGLCLLDTVLQYPHCWVSLQIC